jgi:hypothetical protein
MKLFSFKSKLRKRIEARIKNLIKENEILDNGRSKFSKTNPEYYKSWVHEQDNIRVITELNQILSEKSL